MFCEECGTQLDDESRFCDNCGVRVGDEPEAGRTPAEPPVDVEASTEDLAAATVGVVQQWGVVAVRHITDGTWGDREGMLFPVPLELDTVRTEERDGFVRSLYCQAISVKEQGAARPVMRARDIRGHVLLTESRIAVACSRYEKGGGWWGFGDGALLALPLNAGSHALAAMRRRGKMLVGQVRYPWIESVYGQNKVGRKGAEAIRIVVNLGGKRRVHLDLTLPNDIDAMAVATELIRLAAKFRLAHDPSPLGEQERERLLALADLEPLVYARGTGKMTGRTFPSSWPLSGRSASFGLEQEAVAS